MADPRGSKELISSYTSSITPSSVLSWFNDHGVDTKVESDGRTFPITDDSATVANALLSAARELKVTIQKKALVTQIIPPTPTSPAFSLTLKNATSPLSLDALIVATGSSRQGYDLLSTSFNHTIIAPVPSLFTLTSRSAVLHDLAGVSLPRVSVSVVIPKELRETKKQKYITQTGPVLITHNGLSGPAALKTSAFGARLLHSLNYEADLIVDWAPDVAPSTLEVVDILTQYRLANPKRSLLATTPDCLAVAAIPKRLWANLVKHAGIEKSTWAELNKKDLHHLAKTIKECDLEMTGKGLFKEEFVTAGGVDLKEVNMKSMASKLVKNLFIVGEALNVDAVTGGYNFLNCWTSGFTAGVEAGRSLEATETTEGR